MKRRSTEMKGDDDEDIWDYKALKRSKHSSSSQKTSKNSERPSAEQAKPSSKVHIIAQSKPIKHPKNNISSKKSKLDRKVKGSVTSLFGVGPSSQSNELLTVPYQNKNTSFDGSVNEEELLLIGDSQRVNRLAQQTDVALISCDNQNNISLTVPVPVNNISSHAPVTPHKIPATSKGTVCKRGEHTAPETKHKGHCPCCQMPFCILAVESPRWHTMECMDIPFVAKQECPSGVQCDSTIASHYRKFRHTLLANQRSGPVISDSKKDVEEVSLPISHQEHEDRLGIGKPCEVLVSAGEASSSSVDLSEETRHEIKKQARKFSGKVTASIPAPNKKIGSVSESQSPYFKQLSSSKHDKVATGSSSTPVKEKNVRSPEHMLKTPGAEKYEHAANTENITEGIVSGKSLKSPYFSSTQSSDIADICSSSKLSPIGSSQKFGKFTFRRLDSPLSQLLSPLPSSNEETPGTNFRKPNPAVRNLFHESDSGQKSEFSAAISTNKNKDNDVSQSTNEAVDSDEDIFSECFSIPKNFKKTKKDDIDGENEHDVNNLRSKTAAGESNAKEACETIISSLGKRNDYKDTDAEAFLKDVSEMLSDALTDETTDTGDILCHEDKGDKTKLDKLFSDATGGSKSEYENFQLALVDEFDTEMEMGTADSECITSNCHNVPEISPMPSTNITKSIHKKFTMSASQSPRQNASRSPRTGKGKFGQKRGFQQGNINQKSIQEFFKPKGGTKGSLGPTKGTVIGGSSTFGSNISGESNVAATSSVVQNGKPWPLLRSQSSKGYGSSASLSTTGISGNSSGTKMGTSTTYADLTNSGHEEVTSGPSRRCPFYKRMPGTPFTVDAFKYGSVPGCRAYFLTHFHYDHYQGLTKHFRHPIYCSQITANLVRKKVRVEERFIHPLPMEKMSVVEGIEVTLLEANHCPGSVLLLFKLPDGQTYLHTGDFRANEDMENYPQLGGVRVNALYLDTTYCDPTYAFPPQKDVVRFSVNLTEEFVYENPNTLVVVGSYTIGKERIFAAIAECLNCKICVTREKKNILDCLENPSINSRLTLKPHEAKVHVLPMGQLSYEKLSAYLAKLKPRFDRVLAFEPTGWTHSKRTPSVENIRPKWKRANVTLYGVPYSEHSSYTEMKRFVQFLRPDKILPTVNNGNPTARKNMERLFQEWLSEDPNTPSKRLKQSKINSCFKT